MRIENLTPMLHHEKSFYGKAKVLYMNDGWILMKSYATIICGISPGKELKRFSSAKSMTTSRHIGAFLDAFGFANMRPRDLYVIPVSSNPHGEVEEEQ